MTCARIQCHHFNYGEFALRYVSITAPLDSRNLNGFFRVILKWYSISVHCDGLLRFHVIQVKRFLMHALFIMA